MTISEQNLITKGNNKNDIDWIRLYKEWEEFDKELEVVIENLDK